MYNLSFTPGRIQELRTELHVPKFAGQVSTDSFTHSCGMPQVQYTIAINKKARSVAACLGDWIEASLLCTSLRTPATCLAVSRTETSNPLPRPKAHED